MKRRMRAGWGAVLVVASVAGGAFVATGPSGATTTTVTLFVRAGSTSASCTVATPCGYVGEAVSLAHTYGGDAVTVTVGPGTYTESTITVTATGLDSLTIEAAGWTATKITGNTAGRDFVVRAGTVTITGISIDAGYVRGNGGGVTHSHGGVLTLRDDTFSDDTAVSAWGGAVYNNDATVYITDDTFVDDSAKDGGVITNTNTGTATLTDDTFVTDSATFGGVISTVGSSASLTDDTFRHDSAETFGGAIAMEGGDLSVSASVFDGSSCSTTTTSTLSSSYDVTTTASCDFGSKDETVTTTSLGLAPALEANGSTGPETLAIGPGSSAFEFVPPPACTESTDERGDARPGIPGANCDAGAYEYQGQAVTTAACPAGSSGCNTSASRPGRTVVVGSNGVKVTGTGGRGTVGAGTYRHDPVGTLPSSAGKFFAVSLSTGSTLKTVVVTVCGVGTGTTLEWWNGSAWEHVVASTGASSGPGGDCISVTLGPSTTPSLATITKLSRMSRFGAVLFGVVH